MPVNATRSTQSAGAWKNTMVKWDSSSCTQDQDSPVTFQWNNLLNTSSCHQFPAGMLCFSTRKEDQSGEYLQMHSQHSFHPSSLFLGFILPQALSLHVVAHRAVFICSSFHPSRPWWATVQPGACKALDCTNICAFVQLPYKNTPHNIFFLPSCMMNSHTRKDFCWDEPMKPFLYYYFTFPVSRRLE